MPKCQLHPLKGQLAENVINISIKHCFILEIIFPEKQKDWMGLSLLLHIMEEREPIPFSYKTNRGTKSFRAYFKSDNHIIGLSSFFCRIFYSSSLLQLKSREQRISSNPLPKYKVLTRWHREKAQKSKKGTTRPAQKIAKSGDALFLIDYRDLGFTFWD